MRRINPLLTVLLLPCLSLSAEPPESATGTLPGEERAAPPYGMPIALELAEKVLVAARAEAARLDSTVNAIAVVDTHGELVAFIRMDDATTHSIEFAQVKASSAARTRRVTAIPPPDMAAALTAMPDFVSMPGGIPLVLDGRTIGGIGVSGGDDAAIARAGAAVLQ